MLLYAWGMYERLYRRAMLLHFQDMSEIGHIVHKYNRKTVQQK